MASNPQYTFVMENMLNLMEYVERHPERKGDILRYTREGRMEWGATFNQPYESLMSGEELVRQVYFGRRWLRENFPGCDARVYFNPDVPGRAMQMQQILAKSGIPYMVISRYHQGLYKWASPDGTGVIAFSPGHYGNSAAILNAKPGEGAKLVAAYVEKWRPYYEERGIAPGFPILHSEDFSQPTDQLRRLLVLLQDLVSLEAGQPLQAHVQDGLGLDLREAEGVDEPLLGGWRIDRGADELDHRIEVIQRDFQPFEDMGAFFRLIQFKARAPE